MNPRDEKGEARTILDDYLSVLRSQFYADNQREFFAQRYMLVQAIVWPARTMKSLGVWLPSARIRAILGEIIQGIKRKGDTANIKHFGAYFLYSVQSYVKIRQDHLYAEGKTARALPVGNMPLQEILAGAKVADEAETAEQTTDRLVEIADMFKPKRKPKAAPKPLAKPVDDQLSLL